MRRIQFIAGSICLGMAGAAIGDTQTGPGYSHVAAFFESGSVQYAVGINGRNLSFIDKRTGINYCDIAAPAPIAFVRIGSQQIAATSAARSGDDLRIDFAGKAVATLRVNSNARPVVIDGIGADGDGNQKPLLTIAPRHLVFEVVGFEGDGVDQLTFVNMSLTLKAAPDEPFAACVLARNLKTNVQGIPQATNRLQASCHKRFGFVGASAAVIGCPTKELRDVMKEVVLAAPELPRSTVGGPWALDSPDNRGSYLFNYYDMTVKTVDDWIAMAKAAGVNQFDFHGGGSFRFGDCLPNPALYPNGRADFKAVIGKLHAAGIKAGLHTYAFFIDKKCPWVTPVPDPRLGKDATFTLAADLAVDAKSVIVQESTEKMSNVTDFFIRNSVTLQIDDELVTYKQIDKQRPYAFTECQRGAWGTKPAAHQAGAKVHHLKECFGLFAPDGDSTLLEEVAAKTAEMYNECGFDMIYLDALDGEDVLGGGENGWHYGSKFTFEICKRLKKPAIMEMSTFHHHLWFVRSRMGAWDTPNRGHKRYVDIHCEVNAGLDRQFLPGHLGWWAVKGWTGHQDEPTFSDDMEYLLCKCMGHNVGFSIAAGLTPDSFKSNPFYQRMAGLMRQYEDLRRDRYFDEATLAGLREPGKEFTLARDADGKYGFRPVVSFKHKVCGIDDPAAAWKVENPFQPQTPRIRIEALLSAEAYDSPNAKVLTDFSDLDKYTVRTAAKGVTCDWTAATDVVKVGPRSGKLTATNSSGTAEGAWASFGRVFEPTLNMKGHEAIGAWVHGDGGGQVLNFKWMSPPELIHRGQGEHYVVVNFKGWRYFELIELDGAMHGAYKWPYGGAYDVYRENVDEGNLKTFDIWCNNLPAGKETTCYVSPIKCLPLVKAKLKNPALIVNGRKITFPVEMESGSYLEFDSPTSCTLYGPDGKVISEVRPEGEVPALGSGPGEFRFTCDGPPDARPRARVTVFCMAQSG